MEGRKDGWKEEKMEGREEDGRKTEKEIMEGRSLEVSNEREVGRWTDKRRSTGREAERTEDN